MRLAGKLDGRGGSTDTGPGSGPGCFHIAAAGSSTAAHNHHLFFLRDGDSSRWFLIDTASSFSILPYRSAAAVFGPRLGVANGHSICCWGTIRSSVRIGKQGYHWLFIRANVRFPILGVDCSELQLPPAAVALSTAWQPQAARRQAQLCQWPLDQLTRSRVLLVRGPLNQRQPPAARRQAKLCLPLPNEPSC
jgi:hypothetical protein